jgi:hypothetical protein
MVGATPKPPAEDLHITAAQAEHDFIFIIRRDPAAPLQPKVILPAEFKITAAAQQIRRNIKDRSQPRREGQFPFGIGALIPFFVLFMHHKSTSRWIYCTSMSFEFVSASSPYHMNLRNKRCKKHRLSNPKENAFPKQTANFPGHFPSEIYF